MTSLILGPGATLIRREFDQDGPDSLVEKDVADCAVMFLFSPVTLHADLKLADVFNLFDMCPALHQVFKREWSAEMCEEARKGPVPMARGDNPADAAGIEYLELYWAWSLDTGSNTYCSVNSLDFHGVGPVLNFDDETYGFKAGSRINWSVSLTPLRELLELPVRLREEFTIAEDNVDAKGYGESVASGRCVEVLLGQVIQGILWELSFHGGPEDKVEVSDRLKLQMDEIRAGTADFVSADDLFEEFDRPGFETLFETLGGLKAAEVSREIQQIGDDELAGSFLDRAFGGKVVVKEQFWNRPGREFRKALRAAGR